MIFSPTITINTVPSLSVTVVGGNPPVTYQQLCSSLGTQVYKIDGFYMYSEVFNQLIGLINYNKYDTDGNTIITNINTVVNPFQFANSINVDLKTFYTDVILNGNSSVSTTILPNNYVVLQLYTNRLTNAGKDNPNFNGSEYFFGDEEQKKEPKNSIQQDVVVVKDDVIEKPESSGKNAILLIMAAATATTLLLLAKNK